MPDSPSTVSFHTVGCRLNQAETARIRGQLEQAGYRTVRFGAACDVCVIHGCAVTARAFKDTRLAARAAARLAPKPLIVVAGCAAAFDAESLVQERIADMVVGQADKFCLPDLLAARGFPASGPETLSALPVFDRTRAIIKVQDGCDFHCAYCVVPGLRGPPRSRPAAEILHEIEVLADQGCREFVLTGANLGCYRHGDKGLVSLLERLERLRGVTRVRLSSLEMSTIEREVADFLAGSTVVCRFLHLPLQSGDDRILAAMGRRYRRREYQAAVDYLVRKAGLMGLGTDVITGFPGEDDSAFNATCQLIRELPLTRVHVFAFSPRPGTRADAMLDRVPAGLIRERAAKLRQLSRRCEEAFARTWIGKPVSVLIEGRALAGGAGQGWTREYVQVRVAGAAGCRNQILDVLPERAEGACLHAGLP
jgi:threonylcarbamoyladenosine tRNA methylthiotransferase MtaB